MKTPLQEHIEWLKEKHKTVINHPYVEIGDCIEHAKSMLEKEEVMQNKKTPINKITGKY